MAPSPATAQHRQPSTPRTHTPGPSGALGAQAAGGARGWADHRRAQHNSSSAKAGAAARGVSHASQKAGRLDCGQLTNREERQLQTQTLTDRRAGGGGRPRCLPDKTVARVQPGVGPSGPQGQVQEPGPQPHV